MTRATGQKISDRMSCFDDINMSYEEPKAKMISREQSLFLSDDDDMDAFNDSAPSFPFKRPYYQM